MLLAILSGFIFSLFIPSIYKYLGKNSGIVISFLPAALFVYFLSLLPSVLNGQPIVHSYVWFPTLDIELRFYVDALSLIFALIISGIGTAVFLFASKYMHYYPFYDRFYIYISLFMASMLGVVTSDNLIGMFVFWELTSITSFLLIGFNHHTGESRFNALQAFLVTGAGGLAMLAGLILLNITTGTMNISELLFNKSIIHQSEYYIPIVLLIFAGAFTKSAQVPFHFWLPNAMVAPTPVSAYLHSATMVKAGVYLLARFNPSLGDTYLWEYTLVAVGAATMFTGAFLAIKQSDLKKLLAYTTLSVLGTLTMLIGIGTPLALKAAMLYLIAHSLYKGALFLVAGSIDHGAGTRDINLISGLRKYMPITATTGILAALSMMGFIPFLGFIGKEALYESALNYNYGGYTVIAITFVSSVLMAAVAGFSGIKPFIYKEKYPDAIPHEVSWQIWSGPLILAILGLLFGLFPKYTIGYISLIASSNMLGFETNLYVSLWHGFNIIFIMSLLTIVFAAGIYFSRDKIYTKLNNFRISEIFYPSKIYTYALNGLINTSKIQTKIVQSGDLRSYLSIIIALTIVLAGYSLFKYNDLTAINIDFNITFYEITIALILIMATVMVVRSERRLSTIAGLGVVGFSVAIIFILYGGPDLALTQFAVETLTVILFVLVLYKLPKFTAFSSLQNRIRDLLLAGTFGLLMTLIILLTTSYNLPDDFKTWFAENSYINAYGRNIVNVILVDFRALDTMGEIIVLVIAALGVYVLLKLKDEDTQEGQ